MSVLIETSLGTIVVDLYTVERPKSCLNFLKLCKIFYYNGCLFHSVQKNLVAQTGDPTGTGRGGSSVYEKLYGKQAEFFDCEVEPKIYHKKRGTLSMVNNGYGRHGSQFFLTLANDLDYLNKKHTVFGMVAEGEDILSKINEVYCDKKSRPYRNIRIHHTFILEDPFPDPPGLEISSKKCLEFFPSYQELDDGPPRIEEDEDLEESTADLSEEQLIELHAQKEAKTNAQLLTLLGDLPDPDARPPENVLFVCRLNPVTIEDDLEIIFSRFGEIKSCEVIKDKRTGASLQYAFIEFERTCDCEEAYLKMDNVVIDDRRIHVDFSQSVAKEWHSFRRQKYEDARGAIAMQQRNHSSSSRSKKRVPSPPRKKVRESESVKKSKRKLIHHKRYESPESEGLGYLLSDSNSSSC